MLIKQGVYKITNKVNGKVYYGSAITNFKRRWQEHKNKLNKNKHNNSHLQAAWNKYDASAFKFSIILICSKEHCLYYEQLFLDKYWDNNINCYNIAKSALAPMSGRKHSLGAKEKMSKIQSIIKSGANNPRYGTQRTAQTRNKQSQTIRETLKKNAHKLKSGHTGVHWDNTRKRWQAIITVKNKAVHLGRFKYLEDAIKARDAAEVEYS